MFFSNKENEERLKENLFDYLRDLYQEDSHKFCLDLLDAGLTIAPVGDLENSEDIFDREIFSDYASKMQYICINRNLHPAFLEAFKEDNYLKFSEVLDSIDSLQTSDFIAFGMDLEAIIAYGTDSDVLNLMQRAGEIYNNPELDGFSKVIESVRMPGRLTFLNENGVFFNTERNGFLHEMGKLSKGIDSTQELFEKDEINHPLPDKNQILEMIEEYFSLGGHVNAQYQEEEDSFALGYFEDKELRSAIIERNYFPLNAIDMAVLEAMYEIKNPQTAIKEYNNFLDSSETEKLLMHPFYLAEYFVNLPFIKSYYEHPRVQDILDKGLHSDFLKNIYTITLREMAALDPAYEQKGFASPGENFKEKLEILKVMSHSDPVMKNCITDLFKIAQQGLLAPSVREGIEEIYEKVHLDDDSKASSSPFPLLSLIGAGLMTIFLGQGKSNLSMNNSLQEVKSNSPKEIVFKENNLSQIIMLNDSNMASIKVKNLENNTMIFPMHHSNEVC